MSVYETADGVIVVYLWGRDPWQRFPICTECGCCAFQEGENDLCAGAYEGICHAEYKRLYGVDHPD